MFHTFVCRLAPAMLVVSMLAGCAAGGLTIPIKDPVPSEHKFSGEARSKQDQLNFVDSRPASDKASFSTWIVPMNFVAKGKPLDPVAFVAEHTTKELVARGIPVTQGAGNQAMEISISKVGIDNHRATGFSPMVTLTFLVADVTTPAGKKRMTAYVKRAKVPVWGFDELNDPCYSEPLSLITKELAAKINRDVYGLKSDDAEIDRLVAKVNAEAATNPLSYFDVYQLGFSNNPRAIEPLVKLTSHNQEYVRLAAISSLGILKATSQQKLLENLYSGIGADIWQDRAIALKAIGDLDTPESKAFLQAEFDRLKDKNDRGAVWTKKLIALYL